MGTDRIVDVGAGAGTMLEELRSIDIDAEFISVEPTPELAQICRDKGIRTFEGFSGEACRDEDLRSSASLVMSFEVIEHVVSPEKFVNQLAALCHPGGYILITGLRGSGFDILALGEYSNSVSPPHHISLISQTGISTLLERCGLEQVAFTTPGVLDVDITKNTYAKHPEALRDSFLRLIFDQNDDTTLEALQQFITENNLSSHMWVIARKPEQGKALSSNK